MSKSLSAAVPHLLFLFCEHTSPCLYLHWGNEEEPLQLGDVFSNTGVLPVRELLVVITVMTEMTIRTARLEDLSCHSFRGDFSRPWSRGSGSVHGDGSKQWKMLMMGQGAERAGYSSGVYNFQTPAPVSPFNSARAFKVVLPTGDHTLKAWTCGGHFRSNHTSAQGDPFEGGLKEKRVPCCLAWGLYC